MAEASREGPSSSSEDAIADEQRIQAYVHWTCSYERGRDRSRRAAVGRVRPSGNFLLLLLFELLRELSWGRIELGRPRGSSDTTRASVPRMRHGVGPMSDLRRLSDGARLPLSCQGQGRNGVLCALTNCCADVLPSSQRFALAARAARRESLSRPLLRGCDRYYYHCSAPTSCRGRLRKHPRTAARGDRTLFAKLEGTRVSHNPAASSSPRPGFWRRVRRDRVSLCWLSLHHRVLLLLDIRLQGGITLRRLVKLAQSQRLFSRAFSPLPATVPRGKELS